MPVAGEIIEVNSGLDAAPETVNSDPYVTGWMIKVRLSGSDRTGLLSAADYKALIGH
jgi:glycine cleavage system H protein